MKIILYNSNSENNRVNKSIFLNKIVEIDGYLREQTSLINPQIMIEYDPNKFDDYINRSVLVVDDINRYVIDQDDIKIGYKIKNLILSSNYVYIPEFNRYYFINDITSVRQNLWRLSLHVDVLMSYKVAIGNTKALVTRNEFTSDPMVKDDEVSYYYDKDVLEYIPEKGDKVNKTFTSTTGLIADNITITCINEDIEFNIDSITPPDDTLPIVSANTSGDNATYNTYTTYPVQLTHLAKRMIQDDNLSTFILSIVAYPFDIDFTPNSSEWLKLGTTELADSGGSEELVGDGVSVERLDKDISKYYVIADFTITGDNFMDFEPYSQYEIYLPYLGWISLSADNILNNRIIVYYVVNYQTGKSQVTIYDVTNSKIIYTNMTQLGVVIPVNTTNAREVNDQRNSNNIGLGVGLITSALTTAVGIATYNPVAVAGGLVSGGATIAKYVQNQNTNYSRASGSVGSGQSGLYLPQDVKIRKTSFKPKGYDENYFRLKGRPLNSVVKLSDLSGFTIVGEEHLESFGSATKPETDEINTLLKTGIIL